MLKRKLHTQGKEESQGVGNQVTDQETCFADVLEKHGFAFYCPHINTDARADGLYYQYQVNGSQRSIDFQVCEYKSNKKVRYANLDLKYTTSDIIVLNDGWFHENIIYLVSWMRKTSQPRKKKVQEPETFVGFGKDIPTKAEIELYKELCDIKKKLNADYKGVDCFQSYVRFANRYSCSRFTKEFSEECVKTVIKKSEEEEENQSSSESDTVVAIAAAVETLVL